jgi:hypothetical protein
MRRIVLFIQNLSGDYNFEREYPTTEEALQAVELFRLGGGYVTEEGNVFVPWHRVDFARLTEVEDEEIDGGMRG